MYMMYINKVRYSMLHVFWKRGHVKLFYRIVSYPIGPILLRFTFSLLELLYAESHFYPYHARIPAKIMGCSPWSRCVTDVGVCRKWTARL